MFNDVLTCMRTGTLKFESDTFVYVIWLTLAENYHDYMSTLLTLVNETDLIIVRMGKFHSHGQEWKSPTRSNNMVNHSDMTACKPWNFLPAHQVNDFDSKYHRTNCIASLLVGPKLEITHVFKGTERSAARDQTIRKHQWWWRACRVQSWVTWCRATPFFTIQRGFIITIPIMMWPWVFKTYALISYIFITSFTKLYKILGRTIRYGPFVIGGFQEDLSGQKTPSSCLLKT